MMKNELPKELEGLDIILQDEFIDLLKQFMEEKYSISATRTYTGATTTAAWNWGVSTGMVTNVIKKRKKPTQAMLDDMNYDEHTITFYTKRA